MRKANHQEPNSRLESFGDSPRNWLRITTVRVIVQTTMFALFSSLILLTTFVNLERMPALRHWVSKTLEIDPLVAIATAITTHSVYRGLLWSLVIIIPTFFLGRFFCGWMCPLGSLYQFFGWLFRPFRPDESTAANRYRRSQRIKYYIFAGLVATAVLGSLQIGLLDPIALVHRSLTEAVLPAVSHLLAPTGGDQRLYRGALLVGFLFVGFVAMNLTWPRFFCRVLCPLGALLGALSRFVWWRIDRDPVTCNGCDRCLLHCEGACDPHATMRTSECLVCFNCIEECPENALSFQLFAPRSHEIAGTDVSRRKVLLSAVAGALFCPFMRMSGRTTRDFSSKAIRPPGALDELDFLGRCIKCAQCLRVCPTNVLQPAGMEAGLEGLWTPLLNFRIGHCQLHCTACGQVCPTGAIAPISIERKLGLGAFAAKGAIRLGTAHFDLGRCLPHSKNIVCLVCEEVCPTSPKAIYTTRERKPLQDGRRTVVSATATSVRFAGLPTDGMGKMAVGQPPWSEWQQDGTKSFYLSIRHFDGTMEVQRIVGTDDHGVTIEGRFATIPQPGEEVHVQVELAVPRINLSRCIGCGICERQCPIVGDRRAVYVTADGETRSEHLTNRDLSRTVRS